MPNVPPTHLESVHSAEGIDGLHVDIAIIELCLPVEHSADGVLAPCLLVEPTRMIDRFE